MSTPNPSGRNQEDRNTARALRDPSLRRETLTCLKGIPVDSDEIRAALFELLASDDEMLDYQILAEVISSIGDRAVPYLVQATNNEHAISRWCAAAALGLIGPLAGEDGALAVIKLLEDDDEDIRAEACEALSRIGVISSALATEALPRLLANLRHSNPTIRGKAAFAFRQLGSAAKEACRDMILAFDDKRNIGTHVRHEIIGFFGKLGKYAEESIPRLIAIIERKMDSITIDNDDFDEFSDIEALAAIEALRSMGPKVEKAIPVMKRLLACIDDDVLRLSLAHTLFVIDRPDNAYALKTIYELLASNDDHTRATATVILEELGCCASPLLKRGKKPPEKEKGTEKEEEKEKKEKE